MLLTRSRLCPRPKPGSSLHLHVLGTPPAFVLSQDQTLREELLRRAARRRPASQRVVKVRSAGADAPPNKVADPGPARWWDRPTRPHEGPMYTTGPGRMTGSIWHRRPRPRGASRATASNLDTHLDRGVGRRVRMLLSFQRPSHLFGRDFLPGARPKPIRFRSGPVSIALGRRLKRGPRRGIMAGPAPGRVPERPRQARVGLERPSDRPRAPLGRGSSAPRPHGCAAGAARGCAAGATRVRRLRGSALRTGPGP